MKSVLLIGLGSFGKEIAMRLCDLGHETMAVDLDEERVNDVLPYVTNAQIGDSTDVEFLKSLGARNYDVCIVTIGSNFLNSLETTSLLHEIGAQLIVSRATSAVQAKFLRRNGADEVIYPEHQFAKWVAIRYTTNHILDYIEVDKDHAMLEVSIPDSWIGHTIAELDIRRIHQVNVVAYKLEGKMYATVSPDLQLAENMTLVVFGELATLKKCFNL
jgi:trk system potassium uptake protein TrkA